MKDAYCHLKCLVEDEKTGEDKLVAFIPLFLTDSRIRFYARGYGVYPEEGTCPHEVCCSASNPHSPIIRAAQPHSARVLRCVRRLCDVGCSTCGRPSPP